VASPVERQTCGRVRALGCNSLRWYIDIVFYFGLLCVLLSWRGLELEHDANFEVDVAPAEFWRLGAECSRCRVVGVSSSSAERKYETATAAPPNPVSSTRGPASSTSLRREVCDVPAQYARGWNRTFRFLSLTAAPSGGWKLYCLKES